MTSIFVAKLDFGVDNPQLKAIFETYGTVIKASVAMDRETGKSRGFGFVEMANDDEAQNAIQALDDSQVNGRNISVKQAEDRGGAPKKPFVKGNDRGDFKPRDNRGDFKPRDNSTGDRPAPRPYNSDGSGDSAAPAFNSDFGGRELTRKKIIVDDKKKEKPPKTHKMDAHRKSGKDNINLGDEDDLDEDFDMFGRDEDDDSDDDYSKYIVNSSDEDDDEEYDDEEYDEEDED